MAAWHAGVTWAEAWAGILNGIATTLPRNTVLFCCAILNSLAIPLDREWPVRDAEGQAAGAVPG